jgi:hypothetical protein
MKKVTFILALMATLVLFINQAQAQCPPSQSAVRSLADCKRKCGTNCAPVNTAACRAVCDDYVFGEPPPPPIPPHGRDWCKKLEACTAEFIELIPECDTEEIVFDGDNCRVQFKNCESAKKVAPQFNELCKNKQGCELAPCMYTGTEMPAGSCPDGCPDGYEEVDDKCVSISCDLICADDVVTELRSMLPGSLIELLYALLGMVGLGLILLIILLARKPKDEKKKPAPAPKTAIVPPPLADEGDNTTKVKQPSDS